MSMQHTLSDVPMLGSVCVDYKIMDCMQQACSSLMVPMQVVGVPATAGVLQRPFSVAASGRWLDAAEAFNSIRADKGKPDVFTPCVEGIAAAGSLLCGYKITRRPEDAGGLSAKLQTPATTGETATAGDAHPLQHLAAAVLAGGQPSSDAGAQPSNTHEKRLRACWAVAYALAFLLHPDTQAAISNADTAGAAAEATLLAALVPTAIEVLSRNAVVAFGSSAAGSKQQREAAAGEPVKPMWKKLAAGSKPLTMLLDMTGLEAIKEGMFSIAGKVCPGHSKPLATPVCQQHPG